MTFYSQFTYTLILFTINNNHIFNSIHSKGAYVAGIKAFNHLPQALREH
jgi:hypothetical protein